MIDHDGYDVARWLSSHGVAAFVLKYRLMGQGANYKPDVHALADARRAVRLIRSRAKEWSIDPDRVGMIGFSAGGYITFMASTQSEAGRQDANDPIERLIPVPIFRD